MDSGIRFPTEVAVFTEPLAAACEILEQVQIPCGATVAVLGDGKLGLLIAQVLNAYGLKVRQFGKHAGKLRISEHAGVVTAIAGDTMPAAAFQWMVGGDSLRAEGLRQAVADDASPAAERVCSEIDLAAWFAGVDTAPVIVNEITADRIAPQDDLNPRSNCSAAGLIGLMLREMISERRNLSDAPQAFEQAARKGTMKVLFSCRKMMALVALTPMLLMAQEPKRLANTRCRTHGVVLSLTSKNPVRSAS